MKLIKVGDTVLNMANVVEFDLNYKTEIGNGVRVRKVDGWTDFYREGAEALRHYLTREATDLDLAYSQHLEAEEAKQQRAEWNRDFAKFIESKELDSEFASEYRWWLTNGLDYPENPDRQIANEETFSEWVKIKEDEIDSHLDIAGVKKGPGRDAFKSYCLDNGVYRPTWNAFRLWLINKKEPVEVDF